ncbi:uncharacterized protein METZ01_LOCUS298670, partial [marine metagenome]
MLKQIRYHIIIACICLYSCHEDPEYLLDFDRGDAVPDDISITVNDAFSLNINVTFSDDVELDGVSVYRASSYVWNPNPEFDKVLSYNELDGTTIVILDTGAIYGQYNSYTVASTYKDVESFFSDTVSIYFQMDAPQCTLQLTDSGIQQTIHNNYDFISGIEIVRTSKKDTLIETQPYSVDQIMYLIDSLHYDLSVPV